MYSILRCEVLFIVMALVFVSFITQLSPVKATTTSLKDFLIVGYFDVKVCSYVFHEMGDTRFFYIYLIFDDLGCQRFTLWSLDKGVPHLNPGKINLGNTSFKIGLVFCIVPQSDSGTCYSGIYSTWNTCMTEYNYYYCI